jgi:aryl-alcohol dehydrogenase-like predicted oxidoreductase
MVILIDLSKIEAIMKKRILGKTSVSLSELSFGGAGISGEGGGYGFGHVSEKDAIDLLKAAYDYGINSFDTAPIYGFGLSEVRFGKAFKGLRDKVFITSKSGVSWHETKRVNMTNDPVIAEKMLHQSLIDLQTDYIDLYMVHWPDSKFDIRDTLQVYKKAQEQGKIRFIGLCNTHESDLKKAREIVQIDMVQSEFNLFQSKPKTDVFPFLKDAGFMSWGTLEKGVIPGTVKKNRKYDDVDCRKSAPWWKETDVMKKVEVMEKIFPYLDEINKDGLSLALSYNLSHSQLTTALVGFKNVNQLKDTMKAYENFLSNDELKNVIDIFIKAQQ